MATSTIPAAIDALLTWARTASAFTDPTSSPAVVYDGVPGPADRGICVGVTPEDDGPDSTHVQAELGAQAEWEQYDIPCLIWAYVGGGEEAQKAARDAAFTMLDAVDSYLRTTAGRTLGGVMNSGYAYLSSFRMAQLVNELEQSDGSQMATGRVCEITLAITCKSRSTA